MFLQNPFIYFLARLIALAFGGLLFNNINGAANGSWTRSGNATDSSAKPLHYSRHVFQLCRGAEIRTLTKSSQTIRATITQHPVYKIILTEKSDIVKGKII